LEKSNDLTWLTVTKRERFKREKNILQKKEDD